MAFRAGNFAAKGTVYSRKRGRGATGSNIFRNRASIIYEETEEDTDLEVQAEMNQHEIRQSDVAKAIGNVLKDKSNIPTSPKRDNKQRVEQGDKRGRSSKGHKVSRRHAISQEPSVKQKPADVRTQALTTNVAEHNKGFFATIASKAENEICLDAPFKNTPHNLETSSLSEGKFMTSISTYQTKGISSCSGPRKVKAVRDSKNRACSEGPRFFESLQGTSNFSFDSSSQGDLNNSLSNKNLVVSEIKRTDEIVKPFEEILSLHHLKIPQPLSEDISKRHKVREKTCLTLTGVYSHSSPINEKGNESATTDEKKDTGQNTAMSPLRDVTLEISENDALLDKPFTLEPASQDSQLTRMIGSSPPYSPLNISIDECFQTDLNSVTPCRPLLDPNSGTPCQHGNNEIQEPPTVRKSFGFWNATSQNAEPIYIASPSPVTYMQVDDFIMLRRKRDTFIDDEAEGLLEHQPVETNLGTKESEEQLTKTIMNKKPSVSKSDHRKGKAKPNKWVRFLDVGISCPSDVSDELDFCKPAARKKCVKRCGK